VCDLDVMGDPSKLSVIRKDAALARSRTTLFLNCWARVARRKWNSPLVDSGSWTPEAAKKRSVSRWTCKNKSLTNSLSNLPDVLSIAGINDTLMTKTCRTPENCVLFPLFFENLFSGALLTFLYSICTEKNEKNSIFKHLLRDPKCSNNLELETRVQTFMLNTHPSLLCPWTFVKRSPHWSCDESEKAIFSGDLVSFLVWPHNFIWPYAFLFVYVCMWHVPIRTWSTSRLIVHHSSNVIFFPLTLTFFWTTVIKSSF
jgi:hypothetical protein